MATKPHAAVSEKPPRTLGLAEFYAALRNDTRWHKAAIVRATRVAALLGLSSWFAYGLRARLASALLAIALGAVATLWELYGDAIVTRSFRGLPRRHAVLHALLPNHATRVDDAGREQRVPVDQVAVGDLLRIRPREAVPVDAIILEGRSAVDEQRLTGEPLPLDKRAGQHLLGGSRNGRGILLVRAERSASQGVLSAILERLDSAEHSQSSSVREAVRLAAALGWLSLLVSAIAMLGALCFAPPGSVYPPLFTLSILLVTGPGIYAQTLRLAVARATARGAFLGVLARSADALEELARCTCLVVDKTDTLTEPRARIVSVVAAFGTESELVADAARVLRDGDHPLGAAVAMRAHTLGLSLPPAETILQVPGEGCYCEHDGERFAVGSQVMLKRFGAQDVTLEGKAQALREHGQSVLFCLRGERVSGLIGLTFPIKLTTRDALRELEEAGVHTVIASGDGSGTLQQLATQLELREVHGDLSPKRKLELVHTLKARGLRVCLAARDAALGPALAAADVGIALGGDGELERGAALQLFPNDLAAIARAFTLAFELETSVRRQRRLVSAAQVALPAAILGVLAGSSSLLTPACAFLAGVLVNAALLFNAFAVARDRRDKAEWVSRG